MCVCANIHTSEDSKKFPPIHRAQQGLEPKALKALHRVCILWSYEKHQSEGSKGFGHVILRLHWAIVGVFWALM